MKWSLRYVAIAFTAAVLLTSATGAALAQDGTDLSFLEEKLTLKPNADGRFLGPVTLHNMTGSEADGLAFMATLYISDTVPFNNGQPIALKVTAPQHCADDPCTLPGSAVGQFVLELPLETTSQKLSGYLWVDTAAGLRAEALPLEVTPKPDANAWKALFSAVFVPGSTRVPLIALLFALATAVVALWRIKQVALKSVGVIAWDFSKNWVSTVTAIVAFAGSITGLFTLDSAQVLTKNDKFSEYTFLFALFGLLLLVAPVAGKILSTLYPPQPDRDDTRAWVYVVTVAIVVWAAVGVLLTGMLFIAEGLFAGRVSNPAAIAMTTAALVLALLTCVYAYKRAAVFADQTTKLVEQQDAVGALLYNVRRALAVENTEEPIPEVKAKLTKGVEVNTLAAVTGFDPPGQSVQGALNSAIQGLEDRQQTANVKGILDALKVGLDAVLAALKPSESGRFEPTVDLHAAVDNLVKSVKSAQAGTTATSQDIRELDQRLIETISALPAAPRRVQPKVYLP